MRGFQEKYPDIQVDYSGISGSAFVPKVVAERQAGQYLFDLHIGGTTTPIMDLWPAGVLDPVQPFLVGPETRDTSPWLGGQLDYADNEGQYNLVFSMYMKPPITYNSRLVSMDRVRSYHDLLNPEWRGKIAMRDPRTPGPGQGTITYLEVAPNLGREFAGQLLSAVAAYSKDDRQVLDWVARGQYPIGLAVSETTVIEMMQRGVSIALVGADRLEEGSFVTAGWGSVSVMNRAPHPNAAKVYLNWLLSREGQTDWSVASGSPSRRLDVPTNHVSEYLVVKPGVPYVETYKQKYLEIQRELVGHLT
jgi:iron(III) transport system substrate-binding protein